MDPPIEQHVGEEVVSPRPSSTSVAALGMMSCSSSERSSKTRPTGASSIDGRQDFQTHVEAVQHGHRGLEAALGAMCDRLSDLEGLVEKTQEKQENAEAKCWELRQEWLDRHGHLKGENVGLQHGLSALESRVEDLAQAQATYAEKRQEIFLSQAAPTHDAGVAIMAPAGGGERRSSNEDTAAVAAMREELHALKIKVGIIAANVLGEAESVNMDVTAGTSAAGNRGAKLHEQQIVPPHGEADRDGARSATSGGGMVTEDTSSVHGDEESGSGDPTATSDGGRTPRQGVEDGGTVALPPCVRARNRWVKVRMHRAFLVKKIRRQVMAERKVSQSETIVTRMERLEKALGVNVYTKGSGLLDVLAREVRLSLAMIVEHQARAASDNLTAPLCLFPARPGDLSLISGVDIPSQTESSRASYGTRRVETGARRNSHDERCPRSSIEKGKLNRDGDERGAGDGDGYHESGGRTNGNPSGGEWSTEGGAAVGDEGRLWMTEDGGYLCVDLLLERTLAELMKGLAFAASRLQLGQRLSRASNPWESGRAPIGSAAYPTHAAFDMGDATAASMKQPRMSWGEGREGNRHYAKLKSEFERMQDRCARLSGLVARLRLGAAAQQQQQQQQQQQRLQSEQPGEERPVPQNAEQKRGDREQTVAFAADEAEGDSAAVRVSQRNATTAEITSEVLRLSCALAGDLQYLLSRPAYCRVLDAFSFVPEKKCLCGRDFDPAGNASTTPAPPATAATTGTTANNAASRGKDSGDNDDSADGGGGGATAATSSTAVAAGEKTEKEQPSGAHTALPEPCKQEGGDRRASGWECFGDGGGGVGGKGGLDHVHGFRVRPTLYQCFVLSLSHLSSFLATARSRSAHRVLSTLRKELMRDVTSAKEEAGKAVAAAAKARKGAREASAEALAATARAAAAAASARNEGSFLLEELHAQLAKAMRNERDRLEASNEERARAERERVGQLLEIQLGHLKSLLDTKAGQEDLTSITRAMGEVEETLTTVRESIPGEHALLELQEALSRKADKAYTKRKMSLLVSRVSALLREESDEPSMAKKCLSCDRTFNKLSFTDLELAQKLPDVLESVEDAEMRAQQQQQRQRLVGGNGGVDDAPNGRGGGGREGYGREDGLLRETATDAEGGGGVPQSLGGGSTRPGSAPSARPSTLDPRTFGNVNRPSSAVHRRRLAGAPGVGRSGSGMGYHREKGNATGNGFRPGSGGARARTTRGVGARANTPNGDVLPPAAAGPGGQLSSSQPHLFAPAALSAAYGPLSDGARKAVEAEAARAARLSAMEPGPVPDNIRYGGMTQAPLVRQLFAGLGSSTAVGGSGNNPAMAKGSGEARGTVGKSIFIGGAEGQRVSEGNGRGWGAMGRGAGGARVEDRTLDSGQGDEGNRRFGAGGGGGGGGTGSWKQRRTPTTATSAVDERPPSAGGRGGVTEGFASALEHHRRNVIAVTVPPVHSVGAAGLVPETLMRRSDRGGTDGSGGDHVGGLDPVGD